MRTGLIAKKIGMSSMFMSNGEKVTLTILQSENCQVVSQRTEAKDGYNALVLGAGFMKLSKVLKPMKKLFSDTEIDPKGILKEFRVTKDRLLAVGVEIDPEHYAIGQYVDVSGRSIGKGCAGAMKRHNFKGFEATHGISVSNRSHGSTGQCQDPGMVFKGK